jgi:hypothetical protein
MARVAPAGYARAARHALAAVHYAACALVFAWCVIVTLIILRGDAERRAASRDPPEEPADTVGDPP